MPAERLLLVLKRSSRQEAALETYMQSLQDPQSEGFRKWLTPEEYGSRFGVSDGDLSAVQAWLTGHGLTVNRVTKSRMAVEFSGSVGQVQTAFHTSIHGYLVDGARYWANSSDPQIPSALAPVIAGVQAMHNFVPKSQLIRGPSGIYNSNTHRIEPSFTFGDSLNGYTLFLGPADAATIYDTPTSFNAHLSGTAYDGTGVTIAIAGDSNIDVTQNANYRATFGLPVNAVSVVVDGTDPGENGDAIEAYLDTQVSGGIAPKAKVVLYTAANTSFEAGPLLASVRAIDDNQADILNVSFGECEQSLGAAGNQFIYDLWEQAAAQGISVTVSSADSGSAACDDPNSEYAASKGLSVSGLASTPYNIAVGGTDFDVLYSNAGANFTQYVDVTNSLANHRGALSYIPEEPWNDSTFQGYNTKISQNEPWYAIFPSAADNIIAGGGGVSSCVELSSGNCSSGYALPSWQTSFAANASGRNVPDVSLLAGNGLYGAAWGLCTDLDYDPSNGIVVPDCAGTPTTGNNFNLTGVGGTSAAAPAFAGVLALAAQKAGGRLGQADYVLYNLAKSNYSTVFHDVTTGNNSVSCTAGTPGCAANALGYDFMTGYDTKTGYDMASGLGSLDVTNLLKDWSNAGLAVTASSLTLNGGTAALNIKHGASVAVAATVSGSGGSPSGNVGLVDTIDPATLPNNGSIGSFALSAGVAAGTTNALPGGSYKVSAHYGGSSAYAASDSNEIPVSVSAEDSTTTVKVVGFFDATTGKAATTPYYGFIYLIDAQPYGNSASAANPNGCQREHYVQEWYCGAWQCSTDKRWRCRTRDDDADGRKR
jgi:trimeric autotransporter adhesin